MGKRLITFPTESVCVIMFSTMYAMEVMLGFLYVFHRKGIMFKLIIASLPVASFIIPIEEDDNSTSESADAGHEG